MHTSDVLTEQAEDACTRGYLTPLDYIFNFSYQYPNVSFFAAISKPGSITAVIIK